MAWFKRWLNNRRATRAAHSAAWADAETYGADGRTSFQRRALEAIEPLTGSLDLKVAGESEHYLTGVLPGTDVTLYLYEEEIQAYGTSHKFFSEKWDYESPEALVSKFLSFLRVVLKSN